MFVPTNEGVRSSSSQLSHQFTLSEIHVATQNLDESLVIGRGGFGKVYKGTITNGTSIFTAAIKKLDSTSNQGASEFWAEVNMLSKLRHCHLVSLIGYCNDGQEMILVYEYMSHGTLADHLHRRQTCLSWVQRLTICIGAARGLDYLHTGTGIKHGVIHRDVKSSNILLDESWAAKISDFGLSKICPKNQYTTYVNTGVKGTFGYLDPDYFYTGKLTKKSDVYAFGVVLFEVLCGKEAVDRSIDEEQWGLAAWALNSIKEGQNQVLHRFDLHAIITATENFSNTNKIQQLEAIGSFHKGKLQNGQGIAVARTRNSGRHEHFTNEASILVNLEHENLAKLIGYCLDEETSLLLVYDNPRREILDHLIFEPVSTLLNWDKRYKIILGVARALLYLHRDAPIRIIHGALNHESILLDENQNPVLSGFLNTRYGDIDWTSTFTIAKFDICRYVAPECVFDANVSTKADVYSFGVLLLETIMKCRMSSYILFFKLHKYWLEDKLSDIIDPITDVDSSSMTRFFEIGLLCTQKDADDRPTMEEVVSMLLDSSPLTLHVAKMREMIKKECSYSTSPHVDDYETDDDYDTGEDEDFI